MYIEMDIDEFKKRYPHLAKEILSKKYPKLRVKISRNDPLKGFQPGAVDFIRRASTVKEAEELRKQLHERGLSSFGPRKRAGYYFRYAAGLEE